MSEVPADQHKWSEAETNQAYSVATAAAVAAEAAVVAAQAAAEVVRLAASSTKFLGKSKEDIAAIKIQTAVRGFLVFFFFPFTNLQLNEIIVGRNSTN